MGYLYRPKLKSGERSSIWWAWTVIVDIYSPLGRPTLPQPRQFFSIRITCGAPDITRSRFTAARALRTASSVVA